MTVTQKQKQQQAALHKSLWDMANELRGTMDASEFKNYILGLLFYKYLSEQNEKEVERLLRYDNITYEEAWKNDNFRETLQNSLINEIGYYINPENTFRSMISKISKDEFRIEELGKAIRQIEESTTGSRSEQAFSNLFDDIDLNSNRLGTKVSDRTALIANLLTKLDTLDYSHDESEIDVLGDAYEFLISKFAASAGKKAGEFYTPQQVSKLLAKIVTADKSEIKNLYDATCGSGSLLLRVNNEANVHNYYGQELNSTTFNLARMNFILHGISPDRFNLSLGDTLTEPNYLDIKMDAIVANPPYSAKWNNDESLLLDERFSNYGRLAPKTRADYAFVQHMLYMLDDEGTMAVVLPHGVLFRGAAEEVIRKYIVEEKNYLDAVIGLPENIFFGTGIPTTVLVFKKCRKDDDKVLFIDASNDFIKDGNKNNLSDEHVEKIVATYKERKVIDKYSYEASLEEIKENDCNLNIPRYVDTFEEEEPIDLKEVQEELKAIDEQLKEVQKEIDKYLSELGVL